MTDTSRPPLASRQPPYHAAEGLSDADPPAQQVIAVRNAAGDRRALVHLPPAGSVPHQFGQDMVTLSGRQLGSAPLTEARSEGTAGTRDAQAFGSYGARNRGRKERAELLLNGATSDEEYRREKSDEINLYG